MAIKAVSIALNNKLSSFMFANLWGFEIQDFYILEKTFGLWLFRQKDESQKLFLIS